MRIALAQTQHRRPGDVAGQHRAHPGRTRAWQSAREGGAELVVVVPELVGRRLPAAGPAACGEGVIRAVRRASDGHGLAAALRGRIRPRSSSARRGPATRPRTVPSHRPTRPPSSKADACAQAIYAKQPAPDVRRVRRTPLLRARARYARRGRSTKASARRSPRLRGHVEPATSCGDVRLYDRRPARRSRRRARDSTSWWASPPRRTTPARTTIASALFAGRSEAHGCAARLRAAQVGGNDDVLFDGRSRVYRRGWLRAVDGSRPSKKNCAVIDLDETDSSADAPPAAAPDESGGSPTAPS